MEQSTTPKWSSTTLQTSQRSKWFVGSLHNEHTVRWAHSNMSCQNKNIFLGEDSKNHQPNVPRKTQKCEQQKKTSL